MQSRRPQERPRFRLICTSESAPRKEYILNSLPLVIGRGAESGLRLDDRWVSRRNCEIFEVDGVLWVRDLKSANGTLLNGSPVIESHLTPGDELAVGMTTFVVAYGEDQPSPPVTGSTLVLREAAALALRIANQITRKSAH